MKHKSRGEVLLNIFSIMIFVATICLGAVFLQIVINPYTALNPFPPKTTTSTFLIPSSTSIPIQIGELPTEISAFQPTFTETPHPTFTSIPTASPLVLYTETFIPPEPPTTTPTSNMPFQATVEQLSSTIFHPEMGCNWLGVGGIVEDMNKGPMLYKTLRVQGTLGGKSVDLPSIVSGISPIYGQSGFEFLLGDAPQPSNNTLFIRLFDQSGLPLSDEVRFSTSGECDKNLVLIRFKQVR